MKQIEKRILKDLYKSRNGLLGYTFHRKYNLSVSELVATIDHLTSIKYITYDQDRLLITEAGKTYLEKKLKLSQAPKSRFDKIPSEFLAPKLEINEPFLPTIRYVSEEIITLSSNEDTEEADYD